VIKVCEHPGCDRKVKARGLCSSHYMKARRDKVKEVKQKERWKQDVRDTFNAEPVPTGEWDLGEFLGAIGG
jgi:hypothetical protein